MWTLSLSEDVELWEMQTHHLQSSNCEGHAHRYIHAEKIMDHWSWEEQWNLAILFPQFKAW